MDKTNIINLIDSHIEMCENILINYRGAKEVVERLHNYKELRKIVDAFDVLIGGMSANHIDLIRHSQSYASYYEQFNNAMELRFEPLKYEIMKTREEFEVLKEVL